MKQAVAAVRQFNRNYTKWTGLLDEHLLASRFGLTEARILYELATRRVATASDLIADLGIDPGYLSRILKGFAKSGYVSRERSLRDGRQVKLSLSKKGEAAFRPLNEKSADAVGRTSRRSHARRSSAAGRGYDGNRGCSRPQGQDRHRSRDPAPSARR